MVKIYTIICNALLLSVFGFSVANAHIDRNLTCVSFANTAMLQQQEIDTAATDSLGKEISSRARFKNNRDSLNVRFSKTVPNITLQQILKGNVAGLYAQEANGEPGTEQSMVIQGLSTPIFNKKDIFNVQPAVYVNGVYLAQDNPFAYDVQRYDYNRIGPATNLLAGVDIDNIQSVEILKDPISLAKLGPNAANGAVWITTKAAKSGIREISINSFYGITPTTHVSTVNGVFENNFRKPFYANYATKENYNAYTSFLRDSTNTDYFGKSNWNDLYYRNAALYNVNLGITGGTQKANFRFFGSSTQNQGNADETGLTKYNANFAINMAPFNWVTVSSFVNAFRIDRDRNRSLRDRFAEARYLPSFVNPLSPNKDNYQLFLNEYQKAVDDNRNNLINGSVALDFKIAKRLSLNSALVFDYNEGIRDVFYPTTLMDGNNFVSNYFGYNQRFGLNNRANYSCEIDNDNKFEFEAGQFFQTDVYKYNYARGYSNKSDFIKINVVNGNPDASNYLNGKYQFYLFRFSDKMQYGLMSFYGNIKYSYKDLLSIAGVLRRDGSSNGQPDSRWMTTPAISAEWNLKNQFLTNSKFLDELTFSASWSRLLKTFSDDRFGAGPQYRTETGWFDEPTFASYIGLLGVTRPYNSGWVGYDLTMPYSDRTNLSVSSAMWNRRLNGTITFYNRNDKNQIISLPLGSESGYTNIFRNGLDVNNKGIDLAINADVLKSEKSLNWTVGLNLNYNVNKLRALPDGLNELLVGDNKLKVGKSIGSYWLYTNDGIYNNDGEVPINPVTGQKMTFKGITLKKGDPRWVDYNNDYIIDENDKQITGDRMPKFFGGLVNNFRVGNFDVNFHLFFALGQKAVNQYDASRYDFVNRETANDITSIKEITSWQTSANAKTYPVYNPWSDVIPYRLDQDLFLEDASYLKLRSLTVGYEFSKSKFFTKSKIGFRGAYLYITGNNLFTVTKFSGSDPELVNFTGYYDGNNLPIARTYTLGLKLEL